MQSTKLSKKGRYPTRMTSFFFITRKRRLLSSFFFWGAIYIGPPAQVPSGNSSSILRETPIGIDLPGYETENSIGDRSYATRD